MRSTTWFFALIKNGLQKNKVCYVFQFSIIVIIFYIYTYKYIIGDSAPLWRILHFRDVNSALGKRQLPPPKPSALLTLHGSPVIDNTICPLGSIPVTWNSWIYRRWMYNTRDNRGADEQTTNCPRNSKPSPPLHLTTRHQPGRKVRECNAIRLNADWRRNQVVITGRLRVIPLLGADHTAPVKPSMLNECSAKSYKCSEKMSHFRICWYNEIMYRRCGSLTRTI